MLKFFKKKTPDFIDLETYDYSAFARDMTEEELLTINGGRQIANTNEAVANAKPGDTLTRSDNTTVVITESDIKWAQEQMGSPSTSTTTTTETSSSTSNTSSESTSDRPREQNSASSTGGSRVNMGAGSMTVSDYIAQQRKKGASATLPGQSAEVKKPEGQAAVGKNAGETVDPRKRGFTLTTDNYPDAYGPKKANLSSSINQNKDAEYNKNGNGFQCDNWVEKVLNEAGIDSSKYLTAGDSSKTVADHIAALKESGNPYTMTIPEESGFYCTFMDGEGSQGLLPEHCGILEVKANGSMVFHHNSSAATDYFANGGYGDWDTVSQNDGTKLSNLAYSNFYFQKIV